MQVSDSHVRVVLGGVVIVDTNRSLRVLETSHPPVFYLDIGDIGDGVLIPVGGTTFCEFKGTAAYFDVSAGGRVEERAAWTYPKPSRGYERLLGHVALYPGRMDACYVDDEQVQAQAGDFYGGWLTSNLVGPFKGAPGTAGW